MTLMSVALGVCECLLNSTWQWNVAELYQTSVHVHINTKLKKNLIISCQFGGSLKIWNIFIILGTTVGWWHAGVRGGGGGTNK